MSPPGSPKGECRSAEHEGAPVSFDAFVETAWNDHADRADEVAGRLAASLPLVQSAEHVAPYARLVTHVFGEHLGAWSRGIALLEAVQRTAAAGGSSDAAAPLRRGIATLRHAAGAADALDGLGAEDRVCALAAASSMFAGRNDFAAAIAAFDEALGSVPAELPAGSPAVRALAVAGNNLSASLEEKADRRPTETAAMVRAAEAGLVHWRRAGGRLEEERAEIRLAESLLAAGRDHAKLQGAADLAAPGAGAASP